MIVACAGAGYVGIWCEPAADYLRVAVEMRWRRLGAAVRDAVAGRAGCGVVVFGVVVGDGAGGDRGGGGRVRFGDGEGGGVVVEGWLDGVRCRGVEVSLLGGRVGGLLGRIGWLLGRVCWRLWWVWLWLCLVLLLHLWGWGWGWGWGWSLTAATNTAPRD